jgi:hypothetical protein
MKPDIKIYDVETTYKDKRFLSGVVFTFSGNSFVHFLHTRSLNFFRAYLNNSLAVSFNGIWFDSKVVLGERRKYKQIGSTDCFRVYNGTGGWIEFDLFLWAKSKALRLPIVDSIKRFSPGGLSLNDLSSANLKERKIRIKERPEDIYKKGKYEKLLEYNERDVRLLRGLFLMALKRGWLSSKKRPIHGYPLLIGDYIKVLSDFSGI